MVLRARYTDAFPYRRICSEAMQDGARWIAAPKPQLPDDGYDEHADQEHKSLRNPRAGVRRGQRAAGGRRPAVSRKQQRQRHGRPVAAARARAALPRAPAAAASTATCISTARSACCVRDWRCSIRGGCTPDNLPTFFDGWRILWCPDPIDVGFYPPYEHASQWVGMNLLMLDEQTAIVEQTQLPLIRMLEERGHQRWCRCRSATPARSAAPCIVSRWILHRDERPAPHKGVPYAQAPPAIETGHRPIRHRAKAVALPAPQILYRPTRPAVSARTARTTRSRAARPPHRAPVPRPATDRPAPGSGSRR